MFTQSVEAGGRVWPPLLQVCAVIVCKSVQSPRAKIIAQAGLGAHQVTRSVLSEISSPDCGGAWTAVGPFSGNL